MSILFDLVPTLVPALLPMDITIPPPTPVGAISTVTAGRPLRSSFVSPEEDSHDHT